MTERADLHALQAENARLVALLESRFLHHARDDRCGPRPQGGGTHLRGARPERRKGRVRPRRGRCTPAGAEPRVASLACRSRCGAGQSGVPRPAAGLRCPLELSNSNCREWRQIDSPRCILQSSIGAAVFGVCYSTRRIRRFLNLEFDCQLDLFNLKEKIHV